MFSTLRTTYDQFEFLSNRILSFGKIESLDLVVIMTYFPKYKESWSYTSSCKIVVFNRNRRKIIFTFFDIFLYTNVIIRHATILQIQSLKKNDSAFQFYDILFGVYFLEGNPSLYGRYCILFQHIICMFYQFFVFFQSSFVDIRINDRFEELSSEISFNILRSIVFLLPCYSLLLSAPNFVRLVLVLFTNTENKLNRILF